ncbi:sensor histidine kinase [Clostridium sp. C105KSO13]|uniref:sensor histidine kinase n=1 Tax=Clostridium sp. C105KSO13 TaxID=1776045 RepID=UPI0007406B47|nr:HAMP domain-containing sensor histidine kinase [Clostridium sp. C105KSO13]CUX31488.1 Alkaline phosphatase synthesis sensor protein PhoR [Clostridium sp. C105KSO13]
MNHKGTRRIAAAGMGLTVLCTIFCLFLNSVCWAAVLFLGTAVTAIYLYETYKRYQKLQELNAYLSLICSGEYDLALADNSEGELSILKNNLYKVTVLLRSQNEMLKKDKTYLADSLADISHQLKTPLTSMMVMTELLEEEEDLGKRKEFLSIIDTQLSKMKWLISNLLKISKLDTGTVVFKQEQIPLKDIIWDCVQPFLILMDLGNISWNMSGEDAVITGDRKWTEEAVSNILKNCIEHMEQGGRLQIEIKTAGIYNSVIIRDNGSGISQKDLPHIFERFYHGENASAESVGIGLALAKAILDKENGKISVKSREGKGTEFEIYFYKVII